MASLKQLKIRIFADGADVDCIKELRRLPYITGFTTNPTLMKKAGVKDYASFARRVLNLVPDLPISFEVLSDDFDAMEREARMISSWGKNIFVKIPITDTSGSSAIPVIRRLSADGIQLNITAILTVEQVRAVSRAVSPRAKTIISVFAGRIADTGRDPCIYIKKAVALVRANRNAQILWASSRELFNIVQAEGCGCHIITVTQDILRKMPMIGKDLNALSLETVRMFHDDGKSTGYRL